MGLANLLSGFLGGMGGDAMIVRPRLSFFLNSRDAHGALHITNEAGRFEEFLLNAMLYDTQTTARGCDATVRQKPPPPALLLRPTLWWCWYVPDVSVGSLAAEPCGRSHAHHRVRPSSML